MPIRKYENLHIILWLFKDLSWMMSWRAFGVFMIIPTLGFAIYITYKMRHIKSELFHNLAIIFWIVANSIWMVAEFFALEDSFKIYSVIFFALGIATILCYYSGRFFGKKFS